jgi:hypothetical protein
MMMMMMMMMMIRISEFATTPIARSAFAEDY